jgi:hypothetical protein
MQFHIKLKNLFHGTSQFLTYIFRDQSNQIRSHDASDGADSIDNRHQCACVVWTKVEGVDLHSGVKSTHESDKYGERYNDRSLITPNV